jgi:hypothetical protein
MSWWAELLALGNPFKINYNKKLELLFGAVSFFD